MNNEQKQRLIKLTQSYLMDKKGILLDLTAFFACYEIEQTFLYSVYDSLKNDENIYDELTHIMYTIEENTIVIKHDTFSLKVDKLDLLKIIQVFVDMLAPVFPLGTVVDLKTKYLTKIVDVTDIKQARFVVMQRFLSLPNIPTYIHFGGLVYPMGIIGDGRVFQFTPELVEKVVYDGYVDELEHAYELVMKEEYILNNDYVSIAFADQDVKQQFEQAMKLKMDKMGV